MGGFAETAWQTVRQLWQPVCLMCGQWLRAGCQPPALCHYCLQSLPWITQPCRSCALPAAQCVCSSLPEAPFTVAICPLRYQSHTARWVLRSKRRGGLPEARLLGSLLAMAVADSYGSEADDGDTEQLPDLLLPVPLSRRRTLQRGHNQAAWIAAEVAATLKLPVNVRDLVRRRHSGIQPGLSPQQRHLNVADAFACARRFDRHHVALIDDVMTSGATAAAAARCLLEAGCARVDVWCATRAQPS
jgi:ComF family protein